MIVADGVCVRYGERAVLDGVSLDIAGGECVGLAGASGIGKSTLLRVLLGEQAMASGRAAIGGWEPRAGAPPPGLAGVVYQDPVGSLDRLWSIRRCLDEPLAACRVDSAERARRSAAMLERVRLAHLDPETRVTRLSVGQCQRVATARAMIHRPAAVLADEPTSALDPTTAASVARLLREAADAGAAVLVVSHHRRLLESFCDRVLRLEDGRILPVPR